MGYEVCITERGWQLIADLLAAANGTSQAPLLEFNRVKFGEGVLGDQNPEQLADVISYVADGSSTRPIVNPAYINGVLDHVTVSFVVEFASHKNGADQIDRTWWLSEFAVMSSERNSGEEIAFLRGDFVGCAMFITPFSQGAMDIRQFQVSIVITKELRVEISFVPLNWLYAKDMYDYVENYDETVIQPETDRCIAVHNIDPESHDLRSRFKSLQDMIDKIMEMFNGQGSAPFFWDAGIEVGWVVEKGVINLAESRVEC